MVDESFKAFFLGPKSENESWVRAEIQSILDHWFNWRKSLFGDDPRAIDDDEKMSVDFLRQREVLAKQLDTLNTFLTAETPTYTPRYIGHMVSEISLPAIFGHFAALLHNPNNTSKEVSKVGSQLESQAIGMLAEMVGYDPDTACGHFTSGGTVANFEAIWRARFRLDHWLSLSIYLAEKKGVELNAFAAGHMGWTRYNELVDKYDVKAVDTREWSCVANNPVLVSDKIFSLTAGLTH